MREPTRYLVAGESALVAEFGDRIDPGINRRVRDMCLAVDRARPRGVVDLLPTYRSLLVAYDPRLTRFDALRAALEAIEQRLAGVPAPPPRIVEIPTAYGGEFGPDLPFVAEHAGLSQDEVVAIHSGADYLVYMMGFSPGFTYLGGMSERIATPRLRTPRTAIPAGSVGIAQQQTGIYPVESPGGWQIIGRTPVTLFDPARRPPVAVEAGDHIRFVPVTPDQYRGIESGLRAGTWTLVVREHVS
jgi:KipI family sensor histidine kinase inhibitor